MEVSEKHLEEDIHTNGGVINNHVKIPEIVMLKESLRQLHHVNNQTSLLSESRRCRHPRRHTLIYNKRDGHYENVTINPGESLLPYISGWIDMEIKIMTQRIYWPNYIASFSDSSDEEDEEEEEEDRHSQSGRMVKNGEQLNNRTNEWFRGGVDSCGGVNLGYIDGKEYILEELYIDDVETDTSANLLCVGGVDSGCSEVVKECGYAISEGCHPGCTWLDTSYFCQWLSDNACMDHFTSMRYGIFDWVFKQSRNDREILKKEQCELIITKVSDNCKLYGVELLSIQGYVSREKKINREKNVMYIQWAMEYLIKDCNPDRAIVAMNKANDALCKCNGCDGVLSSVLLIQESLATFKSLLSIYYRTTVGYFKDATSDRTSIITNTTSGDLYYKDAICEVKKKTQNLLIRDHQAMLRVITKKPESNNNDDITSSNSPYNDGSMDAHKQLMKDLILSTYKTHPNAPLLSSILDAWLHTRD